MAYCYGQAKLKDILFVTDLNKWPQDGGQILHQAMDSSHKDMMQLCIDLEKLYNCWLLSHSQFVPNQNRRFELKHSRGGPSTNYDSSNTQAT